MFAQFKTQAGSVKAARSADYQTIVAELADGLQDLKAADSVWCVGGTIADFLAQDEAEDTGRSRISGDIDREAKHLYDKAIELMEYKQYERGLAMLNTVVRDNQGGLLSHMAHMAMANLLF